MDPLAIQLLTHVLDRVHTDLALLESVGCITSEDLEAIKARLPDSFTAQLSAVQISAPIRVPSPVGATRTLPPVAERTPTHPPPPARSIKRVEAKWDYETEVSLKFGVRRVKRVC